MGNAPFRHARALLYALRWTSCLVIALALLHQGTADDERNISIFSNAATYTLPVLVREGHDYVGLVELLDPLGTVNAQAEGRVWRVRYNQTVAEFVANSSKARIEGRDYDLPARFLIEGTRGLVPLSSLGTLLPRVLGGPVTFHEVSRRVLIGSVAVHFTAQMAKRETPALVMNFTSPVNPMISTEPGKLLMTFTRDPVVAPGSELLTFDSKLIASARYEENNGIARITVTSEVPLFASFSNSGQTITVSSAPRAAPAATAAATPSQPTAVPPPAAAQAEPAATAAIAEQPSAPTARSRFFAVVDASHGGEERGSALADQIAEKDVTLAFARSLRQDLEAQGLPTLVLRDGDSLLTLDQRAILANRARPAIYICLHAGPLGTGVRVYTSLIPAGGRDIGGFRDWNTAQAAFLPISRAVSSGISEELQKRHVIARTLTAPLRPLNNVATAAIALEIAPAVSGTADFNSNAYRQQVTGSVAAGILSLRSQLEAGR